MNKNEILKIVGKTITVIRKEKGISLYKLGKITKINQKHLLDIENGKIDFYTKTIEKICNGLNMKISELLNIANL